MKRKYKVLLAIDTSSTDGDGVVTDGQVYQFGDVAELDLETAKRHSHALIPMDEMEAAAKNGEEK